MLAASFSAGSGQDIVKLLPAIGTMPGWKIQQGPEVYQGDKLFDLIDGGADIYFEYGFTQAVSVDYYDPSQNITQAEIYQMTDATSAYGIFSLTQQTYDWNTVYGQLSVVTSDYIAFWKDKYYVNISWASRRDVKDKPMQELAGIIDKNIKETGSYPDLITSFRAMDPGKKVVYMHGNLALSNFYYFDYKDIFEIRDAIACTPGNHHRIILRYEDASVAQEVISRIKQSMSNNKRFSGVSMIYQGFTCEDNKGNLIMVRQDDRFIIVLVLLEKGIPIAPLMDEVLQKIEDQL